MNSLPEVTKVDPKITKKWSVYEEKLFYGGYWGTPLTDPLKYIKNTLVCIFEFHVVLRMGMEKYRVCLVAFSRGCNNNNDASGGGD